MKALSILEPHYGKDNKRVAVVLFDLSNALRMLGIYQKQIELLERALPIFEGHKDDKQVAKILVDLGDVYGNLGNHLKRQELRKRVLPILLKLVGAINVLVNIQETGILLKQALAVFREELGESHPHTIKVTNMLQKAYFHNHAKMVRSNLEQCYSHFYSSRKPLIDSNSRDKEFTQEIDKPCKAFIALQNFESQLNKSEPHASRSDYVDAGFIHPSYYVFSSHIKPDLATQTRKKLQLFKTEMLNTLTKQNLLSSQGEQPLILKPGSFYTPYTTCTGVNGIEKASDQQIANAKCLLGFPIFARTEQEILAVAEQYSRLLGFSNFAEMQQLIPGGIVAYVVNNHSRVIEELRTLQYLEQSSMSEISLWELGYTDVYKKFIEPKLITQQGLVKPQDFSINLLTVSYTNRLFDKLMGMVHEVTLRHSGDPRLYLENCYGFHLCSNPYNFTKHWVETSDWRHDVLKHVSSDVIWNFSDIATRIAPEHELMLCHFRKFGNNVISLKDTRRNATIIVAEITKDYTNMSTSQIAAALLGHDLSAAINALNAQEPQIIQRLRAYLMQQMTKAEFDKQRHCVNHRYDFDPLIGIPLNQLLCKGDLKSKQIWQSLICSEFLYDLYTVTHGLQLTKEPYHFSSRILDKYEEAMKCDAELPPWGEIHFSYKPFDWLYYMPIPAVFECVQAVFIEHYLAKTIGEILIKNPDKQYLLQKFFATLLSAPVNYDKESKSKFVHELANIILNSNILELYEELMPDEKRSHFDVRETMQTHHSSSIDFSVLAMDMCMKGQYSQDELEQELAEKKRLEDLEKQRFKQLGYVVCCMPVTTEQLEEFKTRTIIPTADHMCREYDTAFETHNLIILYNANKHIVGALQNNKNGDIIFLPLKNETVTSVIEDTTDNTIFDLIQGLPIKIVSGKPGYSAGTKIFKKILVVSAEHNQDFIAGKQILLDCIREATSKLLQCGELNEIYCALLSNYFTYTVGIKLRTANQSYTDYLAYVSRENACKYDNKKIAPMALSKVLLSAESYYSVREAKFKLVNETSPDVN